MKSSSDLFILPELKNMLMHKVLTFAGIAAG